MALEPEMIMAGVYLVGGPDLSAPEDCNVYLLENEGELLMIDCGCGLSVERIFLNMEKLWLSPGDIGTLILTHAHVDHGGGAAEIVSRVGARVIAHRGDVDALEGRDIVKTAAGLYGIDYKPVRVDRVVDGEKETVNLGRQELQLLHTPGHTQGSIVVWGDFPGGRVLFGQDIHGPINPSWGSDWDQWQASLKKLLQLKADYLGEGHYGIICPAQKVQRFIADFIDEE